MGAWTGAHPGGGEDRIGGQMKSSLGAEFQGPLHELEPSRYFFGWMTSGLVDPVGVLLGEI